MFTIGNVRLANLEVDPLSPAKTAQRNTEKPLAKRFIATPVVLEGVFIFTWKNARNAPMAIPVSKPPKKPRNRFCVKALTSVPISALMSIVPSIVILTTPHFVEIIAAIAPNKIGVQTRMTMNKKSAENRLFKNNSIIRQPPPARSQPFGEDGSAPRSFAAVACSS